MNKKVSLATLAALIISLNVLSQEQPMASPPASAEGTIKGVKVKVEYHQPSARGRKIMGALVPYGEIWRTGANATTSIEISDALKVEGKELPKGKYAVFTIPGEHEWTLVINKTISVGAYSYKSEEDVFRVNAKSSKTDKFVETFNISIVKDQIVFKWENTEVGFNLTK